MKASEERLTREDLLHRLRVVLAELEAGTRIGLDVAFGWDLDRPYRENWLLYLRDADDVTASSSTSFCMVDPIPLLANAATTFLALGIRLIEEDDDFIRMNIQVKPELTQAGERMGFCERRFGQDWGVTGDLVANRSRRPITSTS